MKVAILLLVTALGIFGASGNPISYNQNDTARLLGIVFSDNRIFNDNNIQNSSIILNIIVGSGDEGSGNNTTQPPIWPTPGPTVTPGPTPPNGTTPTTMPPTSPTTPPIITLTVSTQPPTMPTTWPTFPPLPTNPPVVTPTAAPAQGVNIFNNMENPNYKTYYVRVNP